VKQRKDDDFSRQACTLLGSDWQRGRARVETLTPDGSLRRFCRLVHEDGREVVAIAPPPGDTAGLEEARSGWLIGRHLFKCGVPVPEPYCFEETCGLLVCEDLGDVRLHDLVLEHGCSAKPVVKLYRRAVTELARMQVRGAERFDVSWCWDSPRYDRSVMLEKESGYFLQAMCRDMLKMTDEEELRQEFELLAELASRADASFFLHRDFQCRNIMVKDGRVRFIDFQAGRLGPLAYDLASLLIDPYAALPGELQDELFEQYFAELTLLTEYDYLRFKEEYLFLALQRNLQILGAFSFLFCRRGKTFFKGYIKPSLDSLLHLLERIPSVAFPCLQTRIEACRALAE
jgi:aminoglycoside/choline kinase family phosphotransferase